MNQILSTENNSTPRKNRSSFNELVDMRKIIIIFSVLLVVFAIVIGVASLYGILKKRNAGTSDVVELNKPQISIDKIGSLCVVKVMCDEGLEKVSYWWNDEDVNEIYLNGSTNPFVKQIEIPNGNNNVLNVKAVGSNNSAKEFTQTIGRGDTIVTPSTDKPEITWNFNSENKEITITARSEKGLLDLSYQWEGEEIHTTSSNTVGQKELKTVVIAKRGTNKIYITATDIEGNTQVKEETIAGVLAPEIKMILEDEQTLKLNIKHDKGFKKIIIKVNDEEFVYDENHPAYSIETTEININKTVDEGDLTVAISVYTLEEPEKEYYEEGHANIQR